MSDEKEPLAIQIGCSIAFVLVSICAAVAVGYRILIWGGIVHAS